MRSVLYAAAKKAMQVLGELSIAGSEYDAAIELAQLQKKGLLGFSGSDILVNYKVRLSMCKYDYCPT